MYILNPRVIIEKSGKVRNFLFGHKFTVYFAYAKETETEFTRGCITKTDQKKSFVTAKEAYAHADKIKLCITGKKVSELYCHTILQAALLKENAQLSISQA